MEEEIWKDIVGYENLYQISSYGRARSIDRMVKYKDGRKPRFFVGKILKPRKTKDNYLTYNLPIVGKYQNRYIHRLVAEAFLPNPENKKEVNHIDFDVSNNCVSNLEWVTPLENTRHSISKNRVNKKKKIMCFSLNYDFICEYSSSVEASLAIGKNSSSIRACARGDGKSIGGYRWKYSDSIN